MEEDAKVVGHVSSMHAWSSLVSCVSEQQQGKEEVRLKMRVRTLTWSGAVERVEMRVAGVLLRRMLRLSPWL